MDPISISIELELATLLLAAVGGIATWMHNKHSHKRARQRERHHREHMALMRKNSEELQRATRRVSAPKVRYQSVPTQHAPNGHSGAPSVARKAIPSLLSVRK